MAEIAQIDFTIDGAPAAKTLGELEIKATQLKDALKGAEMGSDDFKRLNSELQKTGATLDKLNKGFKSANFDELASGLGQVAGAVGDVSGAFILLGGNSEEVEKVALNIQKAIGISMAFKGAIEGVSGVMKILNNILAINPFVLIGLAIAAVIVGIVLLIKNFDAVKDFFLDMAIWVKDTIDGFGKWKYVILALLGPIGLLIAAWDYFFGEQVKQMGELEKLRQKEEEKRQARMKAITDDHKKRLEQIDEQQKATIAAADETIKALELERDTLEAQGKTSDAVTLKILEAEKEKTVAVLEGNKARIESWIKYYQDQAILSGQSEAEFKETMRLRGIDLEKLHEESLKIIKANEDAIQYSENKITKFKREQHEKRVAAAQEEADKLKQLEAERLEQEEADRLFKLAMLERQQEADRLFNERLATEEQRLMDEEFERLETQIDRENQLKEQQAQMDLERMERNREAAQSLFDAAEGFANLLHQRELKRVNEKIARGEALTQREIKRLQRQDKIDKLFALAKIAKDTAQGISGAIAAGAGIPFPGNLFAIASGVAAVIAGITQAAQVLGEGPEIPSSGLDSTGGNVPGAADQNTNVPTINPVQSGSTFLNQEPQMVYVVESDITNKQNKVKAIISEATYG